MLVPSCSVLINPVISRPSPSYSRKGGCKFKTNSIPGKTFNCRGTPTAVTQYGAAARMRTKTRTTTSPKRSKIFLTKPPTPSLPYGCRLPCSGGRYCRNYIPEWGKSGLLFLSNSLACSRVTASSLVPPSIRVSSSIRSWGSSLVTVTVVRSVPVDLRTE